MHELYFLTNGTKFTNHSVIQNDLHGGELSSTATILYSKLLNRSNLSITNGKVDGFGRIYINYKLEDLAEENGQESEYDKGEYEGTCGCRIDREEAHEKRLCKHDLCQSSGD